MSVEVRRMRARLRPLDAYVPEAKVFALAGAGWGFPTRASYRIIGMTAPLADPSWMFPTAVCAWLVASGWEDADCGGDGRLAGAMHAR